MRKGVLKMGMKKMFLDLTGQKFSELTVIRKMENDGKCSATTKWHCECSCGRTITISSQALKYGIKTSCGCMKGKKEA
jgi:hypothetical protein